MVKKSLLILSLVILTVTAKSQDYLLGILPNSTPNQIAKKYTLENTHLNGDGGIERFEIKSSFTIAGVNFVRALLTFKNEKIRKLSVGIDNENDLKRVQKYISMYYGKGKTGDSFEFKDVTLRLNVSERAVPGLISYAYLIVEY